MQVRDCNPRRQLSSAGMGLLRDHAPRRDLVRDVCRVTDREAFVLDSDGLAREERTRNSRLILGVLADDADSYETYIPNGRGNDKPNAVMEAAERLFRATRRSGLMDLDYAQTGVLRNADAGIWAAFVTFAPYAYDATVWDIDGRRIADFSDEGTAIVVLLTSRELPLSPSGVRTCGPAPARRLESAKARGRDGLTRERHCAARLDAPGEHLSREGERPVERDLARGEQLRADQRAHLTALGDRDVVT